MKTKTCVDCGEEKKLSQFSKRPNYNKKSKKVYWKSQCRKCATLHMAKWVDKNRERFNKYQREYNENC